MEEGIVSDVYTEVKQVTPPELIEAQRIQIDSEYGMRVRHQRELVNIAENATAEEQLLMAMKMDFSVLCTAIYNKYDEKASAIDKINSAIGGII